VVLEGGGFDGGASEQSGRLSGAVVALPFPLPLTRHYFHGYSGHVFLSFFLFTSHCHLQTFPASHKQGRAGSNEPFPCIYSKKERSRSG
jgi:hypothetical protein